MNVFRLEVEGYYGSCPNVGIGVYQGNHEIYEICTSSNDDTHPTPHNEGLLCAVFTKEHVCVFDTLHDLERWFDKLKTARMRVRRNFRIREYTIPDEHYTRGRWQSIALAKELVAINEWNCQDKYE